MTTVPVGREGVITVELPRKVTDGVDRPVTRLPTVGTSPLHRLRPPAPSVRLVYHVLVTLKPPAEIVPSRPWTPVPDRTNYYLYPGGLDE